MNTQPFYIEKDSIRKDASGVQVPAIFSVLAVSVMLSLIPGCGTPQASEDERSDAEKATAIDSMYEEYRSDFPDAAEISVLELLALQDDQDVLVVDVRTHAERSVSNIPGAISKASFEAMKGDVGSSAIVVHCTIGYRSGQYVEELKSEGIEARNLKGSILSWVHAGQPVVDSAGNETKRVHVYGERWNLLPAGYEAIW